MVSSLSHAAGLATVARRVIEWSLRLSRGQRHLLTILAVGLAIGLRLVLSAMPGPGAAFITFYPAVLLTCVLGGLGSGLLATALCAVAGLLFIELPWTPQAGNYGDVAGLGVFGVMGVVMAILGGELRRIAARSREAAGQLTRNQELMRLLIEGTKDYAVFCADPEGRVVLWGAGAQRIFGYEYDEIFGKHADILFVPEDVRRNAPEKELETAASQGLAEDDRWHQRKDGSRFFASGVVRPLRDHCGQLIGFLKIARDMTERRRADEELRNYRERLEELVAERTEALKQSLEQLRRAERLASIGTLAAGIAHEINNPLNSILLTAEFARRFPEDTDTPNPYGTIMAEARRCGQIVRGILKFAKDEKTPKDAGDLHDVIHRVAGMIHQYVASDHVWLDIDLAADLPAVAMNPTEMEQVLVNLIKNAVEAACDEEVRVVIRTLCERDDAVLIVEDNGPGMEPDTLRQIFDPFFSTRQNRGGTGLGLSICHGIISEHGGTITAHSSRGEGTTFTIRLPALEPHVTQQGRIDS